MHPTGEASRPNCAPGGEARRGLAEGPFRAEDAREGAVRAKGQQGLLPFVIESAPRPMDLTARAGLTLVVETLLALGLDEVIAQTMKLRSRRRGHDEFAQVAAIVLVQAAGGESVEDVSVLGRDEGLKRLLGVELPSPDALHRFLARFHDESAQTKRPAKGAWIPEETDALRALHAVNVELVRRATRLRAPGTATLDLDATIIESHKRDALAHYKGGRGYQPTAVLWAEEDLLVADEYRDGNVPAAMRTLEIARRALEALPVSITDRAFRADSACYDERLLKHLVREKIRFTISADMSPELRRVCTASSVAWKRFEERATEDVEVADVEFTTGNRPKNADPLRYVALRFTGTQEHLFADGQKTKHLAVVSNRRELSASELVRWHWQKAGTIEYAHDVTKNDLGARLPPSGRFGANAAWYRLSMLTYNVLTTLRRVALPERLKRARPTRLRYELFTLPAEISTHARQLTARLGAAALTVDEVVGARGQLRDFRAQLDREASEEGLKKTR